MRRTIWLAVLTLVIGAVAGFGGASWLSERNRERAANQVRLIVTADDAWQAQLDVEGCSSVPLDVYNAGDRPVVILGLRASITEGGASSCRESSGRITIPPRTRLPFPAAIGFRCEDEPGEPTFTATISASDSDSVNGPVHMKPFDLPHICQDQTSTFWVGSAGRPETGSSPRLPITLAASSSKPGAKLAAVALKDSKAFALHPRSRLPIDISSLAPGAAPPEVRVDILLSVRDCVRAREFRPSDLTLEATFDPPEEPALYTLGDRRDILQLIRLVDAAC